MPWAEQEAREELLDAVAGVAPSAVPAAAHRLPGGTDPEALRLLLRTYFGDVALQDLRGRGPGDLLGAAVGHAVTAAQREPGRHTVRVFNPDPALDGWSCPHTVIEIVTDDMRFLVDSVSAELARQDCGIALVVHPQVVVRRDADGGLVELLDAVPAVSAVAPGTGELQPAEGVVRESWLHVEVARIGGADRLDDLAAGLDRVLGDVRRAVADWGRMRARAGAVADGLRQAPPDLPLREVEEARALLEWLTEDHFTFIGFREYRLVDTEAGEELVAVPGTGLGVLRYDRPVQSTSFGRLTPRARSRARDRRLLVLTKANSRSTVHRGSYLDYIGVKTFDETGAVSGELRFLGLFGSGTYLTTVRRIPVIRRKVAEVLRRSGFPPDSYSGRALTKVLENYPRDELFEIDPDDLYRIATGVVALQERRRTRLFLRRETYGRYESCLVYLPRDRYTTASRLRIQEILRRALNGVGVDHAVQVSDSVLARLHLVVRVAPGTELPDVDADRLEAELVRATRSWEEDLAEALTERLGERAAGELTRVWGQGFPEGYRADVDPADAVDDLVQLDHLDRPDDAGRGDAGRGGAVGGAVDLRTRLYRVPGAGPSEVRLKLYRREPLTLSSVLPYLTNLGVEVVDERPHRVQRSDGGSAHVYDFGLRFREEPARPEQAGQLFCAALTAAWAGRTESDGFDQLVIPAGLSWRQVLVLRVYARYMRQIGTTFSQEYIQRCLSSNLSLARLLVQLFEARFDPDLGSSATQLPRGGERTELTDVLGEEIQAGLDAVASLDHDRILRAVHGLIMATTRTNFFRERPDGAVSLKFDPHLVPDLPAPRPAYEVFVYSPRVEGVHLRFGKVARGGLRWSDRLEDFRTEVLGLVKAQTVKNAVIVPTGAKGGFVCKRPLDPVARRQEWSEEGRYCYTVFVSSLLDLTDNLAPDQTVLPPARVIRHDDDDPYLVVAADKGTATFSDLANRVAAGYGFWLGDAFASGGSAGYDHKAMGITARGAWESVKRHFQELGRDVQSEDFTAVGIGDMSGDVFGNGMLLSEHLRLVAAFDHRHVFLDPDPDPALSLAERRRLFALPTSSWADYDPTLLSPGGGVHSRSAKSVTVPVQACARLGLGTGPVTLTPAELIKAILRAPVDLLWNGGIGTYVKATHELNTEVGDKANDAIRVDGSELRVHVIGEGGNLGLTQLGRVEAAQTGVRVNTDAIDNSAGVDCSDHEVNIKILLDRIVAAGDLDPAQRNALLAEMTDDVAALVLRDNYEQNVLLGNARRQSRSMVPVHLRFLHALESSGHLDRGLEFLPSDAALLARGDDGIGLTAPEFSVLVAYAKITLGEEIVASDLPDHPWFAGVLAEYFPRQLVQRFRPLLGTHPLRREIITTCLVNEMVNRGGITFAFRVREETGAGAAQVARAYTICREVFGLRAYVAAVETLDNLVPTEVQTALYLSFRRLLDRAVRWFLQTRPDPLEIGAEIDRFTPAMAALSDRLPELLVGSERTALQRRTDKLVKQGVPHELAQRAGCLLDVFKLLDVTEIAQATGVDAEVVARVHLVLSERYGIEPMLSRIAALGREDRWQALARGALRYDLYAALEALTVSVLTSTEAQLDARARVARWEAANAGSVARASKILAEVRRLEHGDLASLSVALRTLRSVVKISG